MGVTAEIAEELNRLRQQRKALDEQIGKIRSANKREIPKLPIQDAIKAVGGQKELAQMLNVHVATVSGWATGRLRIAPERCIPIELACNGVVTRYQLRPDVFVGPDYGKDIEGEMV